MSNSTVPSQTQAQAIYDATAIVCSLNSSSKKVSNLFT